MSWSYIRLVLATLLVVPTLACAGDARVADAAPTSTAAKGGDDRTGGYEVVEGWWKPAPNHGEWGWGDVAGVAVDNPDRIVVIARGDRPSDPATRMSGPTRETNFIVVADRNGNIVEQWTQWDSILTLPHQVYINPYDPERHVWVVDGGGANGKGQVVKFSNDGSEVAMRLGPQGEHLRSEEEARARSDWGPYTYGLPSKLAFLPDGTFLLADGYWNSRIVRYAEDGTFISQFGEQGTGPGQFDLLHGLAVDDDGRIYVADRMNSRIQIFTPDGDFIEEWSDIFDPVNIWLDEDGWVWIIDATLNRIMKFNRDGELQYHWGTYGRAGTLGRGAWPGGLSLPHQMDIDEEGNVYIASYSGGWVDKFVPRPDADPSKLFGARLRLD